MGRQRTVIGYLGDVDDSRAHLEQATALAECAGATDEVLRAHNLLWAVLSTNDRHEEGLAGSTARNPLVCYSIRFPERARAMTSCWIRSEPSQMLTTPHPSVGS